MCVSSDVSRQGLADSPPGATCKANVNVNQPGQLQLMAEGEKNEETFNSCNMCIMIIPGNYPQVLLFQKDLEFNNVERIISDTV